MLGCSVGSTRKHAELAGCSGCSWIGGSTTSCSEAMWGKHRSRLSETLDVRHDSGRFLGIPGKKLSQSSVGGRASEPGSPAGISHLFHVETPDTHAQFDIVTS